MYFLYLKSNFNTSRNGRGKPGFCLPVLPKNMKIQKGDILNIKREVNVDLELWPITGDSFFF
jgi:hypothetical protein